MPIAHGEGNYYVEPDVLHALEGSGRVVFRYCDAPARSRTPQTRTAASNAIAGVCSERATSSA